MFALTRRAVLVGEAVLVAGCAVLGAQTPPPRPPQATFSTGVEVVQVFATVRDKKGHIVTGLTQEEFTLREDGRPQEIEYFFRESDLPLTIGLLVDTTPSESNMLEEERDASLAFLTRMLRPGKDQAFLIQYHAQVDLLQGLTSSRELLEEALNQLESHGVADSRGRGWGGQGSGGGGQRPEGGGDRWGQGGRMQGAPGGPNGSDNVLADAVYLASDEIMKGQVGRKALFILGDGDHLGDRAGAAIEAAERTDTIIYAIRIADRNRDMNPGGIRLGGGGVQIGGAPGGFGRGGGGGVPGGGPPGMGGMGRGPGGGMSGHGKENLKRLAKETGGGYFEAGKKETLDRIYAAIEEELRNQYDLGYRPDPRVSSGYHGIKVEVKRKGLTARGREGYYTRRRP